MIGSVVSVAADTDIELWLEAEGILDRVSRVEAKVVLAAAGLTRAGKQRMANHKLARAREVLWAGVTPVCADGACVASLPASLLPVVTTTRAHCVVCGGSNTRRAMKQMLDACSSARIRKILLVGGSSAAHVELKAALAGSPVEMRIIDGLNDSPTNRTAIPDLEWAQLLVIWASTQLPHRVSQSFTEQRPRDLPLITVARRGVEALCQEVTRFAQGLRRRRSSADRTSSFRT